MRNAIEEYVQTANSEAETTESQSVGRKILQALQAGGIESTDTFFFSLQLRRMGVTDIQKYPEQLLVTHCQTINTMHNAHCVEPYRDDD